jgi:hypothetical protein
VTGPGRRWSGLGHRLGDEGAALVEGRPQGCAPLAGDVDDAGAAVGGVGVATDESLLLQLVHVTADGRGVEAHRLGQVADAHCSAARQRVEDGCLGRVDGVAVDAHAKAPAHRHHQPQHGILGGRGVLDGGSLHDASIYQLRRATKWAPPSTV